MAWTNFVTLAGVSDKTAGTSIVFTVGATGIAAGGVALVLIAMDNIQITGSEDGNDIASLADSKGNTYVRAKAFTNANGAPASGVTVGIYFSKLVSGLSTGDTVTCTFNGTVTASAMTVGRIDIDATTTPALAGYSVLANDSAGPGPITVSGIALREYLWVHACAHEGPSSDIYTQDADYTGFVGVGTTGGAASENVSIQGGVRIFTGVSDTVDVGYSATNHAQAFVALREGASLTAWVELTSSAPGWQLGIPVFGGNPDDYFIDVLFEGTVFFNPGVTYTEMSTPSTAATELTVAATPWTELLG